MDPIAVRQAAGALYLSYGRAAVGIARERAERLHQAGDFRVLDGALLVLTEVERLVGPLRPTPAGG
jgi:hypothetical protein